MEQIYENNNIIPENKKSQYNKTYYNKHKADLLIKNKNNISILKESKFYIDRKINKLIDNLNDGIYKRTPYTKLQKYNICYNNDTKSFFKQE
jgi:hypothetical protein